MSFKQKDLNIAGSSEDDSPTEMCLDRNVIMLTSEQKILLRKSWFKMHKNMESVGVVTFLNLFETHPETMKPFLPHINSIKERELDEWYQEKLRIHAIRVMAIVEKTLNRIDCEAKAAKMLSVYGRRHESFGVCGHMLDNMSDSFIVAIQPAMQDDWNRELEEAWRALFKFIVHSMKYYDEGQPDNQPQCKIPDPKFVSAVDKLRKKFKLPKQRNWCFGSNDKDITDNSGESPKKSPLKQFKNIN